MGKFKICSDCGDDLNFPEESKRNICNTCNCIRSSNWQKNNPEKVAAKARRASLRKYGLTEEQYSSMLKSQNDVCKICKKTNKNGQKLTVDHCHRTGNVRGILCKKCNSLLGLSNDDTEILQIAIEYLKNSKQSNP